MLLLFEVLNGVIRPNSTVFQSQPPKIGPQPPLPILVIPPGIINLAFSETPQT